MPLPLSEQGPDEFTETFVRACTDGDVRTLGELLARDPALARAQVGNGSTGLHAAVRHPAALRLLLEHGADPNARDVGDNASALHFAAASGAVESVRVLLDAGADVHGPGDLHESGVIGWASRKGNEPVVTLLLERGARHHIFSAIALSDHALVERLVDDDPTCLHRRRSRFENGQTPVLASFVPPDGLSLLAGEPDHRMLKLLIELGADVNAPDDRGRTPLQLARLRGDGEAIRLLVKGGAAEPARSPAAATGSPADLAGSVKKGDPMFRVRNVRETVRWYRAIGFTVLIEHEDGSDLVFARLSFGACEFSLSSGATTGSRDVSLWLYTDRVEDLYRRFRTHQTSGTGVEGAREAPSIQFDEDLYAPFYGGRQFSIRDPNGLSLIFWQPDWLTPTADA